MQWPWIPFIRPCRTRTAASFLGGGKLSGTCGRTSCPPAREAKEIICSFPPRLGQLCLSPMPQRFCSAQKSSLPAPLLLGPNHNGMKIYHLFSKSSTGNRDKTKRSLFQQSCALAIHTTSAVVRPSLTKTKRATNELVLCYKLGISLLKDLRPQSQGDKEAFNSLIPLASCLLKLQRWLFQPGLLWFLQRSPLVSQPPLFSVSLRHFSLSLLAVFGQSPQESHLLVYSF